MRIARKDKQLCVQTRSRGLERLARTLTEQFGVQVVRQSENTWALDARRGHAACLRPKT